MKKPMTQAQALAKAAAMCSASEHCASQIQKKLSLWGIEPKQQEEILTYLITESYIDEGRFALAYANDKFRYNHWGPMRIDNELRLLGISASQRSEAIAQLCTIEQRKTLYNLLCTKASSIKGKSSYERNGKLIRFALSRGFCMDDILNALESLNMN